MSVSAAGSGASQSDGQDTMTDFEPRADDDDEDKDDEKPSEKKDKNRAVQKILFDARMILVFGEINEKSARETVAQLLALDAENDDPIRLVISSPGGHVESGDAIHDMIQFVKSPVKVIGTGWVASAGAHIFLAARKDNRYCTPNTRFLLHQPMGGVGGKATEIDIEAKEILKMRERLNRIISEETGQPIERVAKDTDRNYWMGPTEAKDYGVVTHIVKTIADVK
jgi:ATP-dependent Clp protease protease subunit